jgi:hypothetical protein
MASRTTARDASVDVARIVVDAYATAIAENSPLRNARAFARIIVGVDGIRANAMD